MLQIQETMVCSHRPAWDWSPIRQAGGELEVENGSAERCQREGKKTGRKGKRLRTSKRRKENNLD